MLQGANGLKGEQMIDKFKAKCSEGGKKGGKNAVKSNAAFADATGVKGSEGQKSMVVVLSGGQVRGVKLPCAACPACSSRYRLSAVLIMHRLCCKRACGNRGGLTPCRSTGRERAHGRAEASQGQGQVLRGRQVRQIRRT